MSAACVCEEKNVNEVGKKYTHTSNEMKVEGIFSEFITGKVYYFIICIIAQYVQYAVWVFAIFLENRSTYRLAGSRKK